MVQTEIDAIRELLGSKPRPAGWAERRQRLDEVGSVWPIANDVKVQAVDLGGLPGEWSIVPGSDASQVLLFFHGGGYCSGSILSHHRLVTEAGRAAGRRTLAVGYRLAPEHPFPLLADATRFAAAAGAADVPVTLEVWPHMIHAWPLWNARLEAGREALADAGAFIRRND
jgi:acetyl esterase/lipase